MLLCEIYERGSGLGRPLEVTDNLHSKMNLLDAREKKEYKMIDFLKLFFAISMIFRHSNYFVDSKAYWGISTFVFSPSVPFFFVASGFFLGKKIKILEDGRFDFHPSNYIKRLLKKLIVFEILNIILAAIQYYMQGYSAKNIGFKIIRAIVFYPFGALWYLQAVIVAVLLLLLTFRWNKQKWIPIAGAVLYLVALLGNNYSFLISGTSVEKISSLIVHIIASYRNGIFVGYFFVGVGMLISLKWEKLSIAKIRNSILFSISFLIYVLEAVFLMNRKYSDDGSLFLSFVFFIPLLFIFAAQMDLKRLSGTVLLRNLSTSVYLIHSPVILACQIAADYFGIQQNKNIEIVAVIALILIILFPIYKKKLQPAYDLLR